MGVSEFVIGGAAVVQALGSIWAIMSATRIASRQADRDQRLRREELLDRVESVAVMIRTCRDAVLALQAEILMLPANNGLKAPRRDLQNAARVAINLVSMIRPELAPTPTTAAVLLRVQTAIANSIHAVPESGAWFPVGYTNALENLCQELTDAYDDMNSEVGRVASS